MGRLACEQGRYSEQFLWECFPGVPVGTKDSGTRGIKWVGSFYQYRDGTEGLVNKQWGPVSQGSNSLIFLCSWNPVHWLLGLGATVPILKDLCSGWYICAVGSSFWPWWTGYEYMSWNAGNCRSLLQQNQPGYLDWGGVKAKEMSDERIDRKHRVDSGGLFGHEFISELVFIQIYGRRRNKEQYSELTISLHCPWEEAQAASYRSHEFC